MENAGDILNRLVATRSSSGGSRPPVEQSEGDGRPEPCDECGGRGWFTPNVPVGHPDFGQVITCGCRADRINEERSVRLLRYSNLGYLTRFTFESMDPAGLPGDAESRRLFGEAYRRASEFAEDPAGWLVLTGPHGTGKTHLAAAVANRCIERGHVVFFVHVPDLLDHPALGLRPDQRAILQRPVRPGQEHPAAGARRAGRQQLDPVGRGRSSSRSSTTATTHSSRPSSRRHRSSASWTPTRGPGWRPRGSVTFWRPAAPSARRRVGSAT